MKVGLYAIAKNEMKNLEAWLENMDQGLDYIAILDTGSTDGTWEYLQKKAQEDSRFIIKQEVIKPWRFDVARNKNLDMLPRDCDVCVCTDEDERWLTKNWVDVVRENWVVGESLILSYRFDQSIGDDGVTPLKSFAYNKIHSRDNIYWKYPVHECVFPIEGKFQSSKLLWEELVLQHFPEVTKPRDYAPLIMARAEEYQDGLSFMYAGIVHDEKHNFEEAIKWYQKASESQDDLPSPDKAYCALRISRIHKGLGHEREALAWTKKSVEIDPSFREGWIDLCSYYLKANLVGPAYGAIRRAINQSKFHARWVEDEKEFQSPRVWHLATECSLRLGNIPLAKAYLQEAIKVDPEDETTLKFQEILKGF